MRRAERWWRYCCCLWPGLRWSRQVTNTEQRRRKVCGHSSPCCKGSPRSQPDTTDWRRFYLIPGPNYFVIATLRSNFQHHNFCRLKRDCWLWQLSFEPPRIFFPSWLSVVFKGKLTVFMALRSVSSVIVFHWRMFLQSSFLSNLPGQWLFFSNLKLLFILL